MELAEVWDSRAAKALLLAIQSQVILVITLTINASEQGLEI